MPLVNAFYKFDRNGCGGSLHIVLDDRNIEDSSVDFCLNYALGKPETRHDTSRAYEHDLKGELLARILRLMSYTQRGKLARDHDGHHGDHEMPEDEWIVACEALLAKYDAGE